MKDRILHWQRWIWWVAPALICALALGWEIDWGRHMHYVAPLNSALPPKPVALALLPDYRIDGGLAGHDETVKRTLFNPTRRPAPPIVTDQTVQRMQRGQFALTGTTLAGERSVAFLREVQNGKSRMVKQGDEINGMRVSEVKPDRVKLTLGGEAEELLLRVAVGPKITAPPPATQAAPSQFGPLPPGGAVPSHVPATGQPQGDTAASAQERRRAARAAGTPQGQQAVPPASAVVQPPAPTSSPAPTTQPAWNEVYRRMQQRQQ